MPEPQYEYAKLIVRRLYDAQKLRIQSDLRLQRLIREGIVLKEQAEATFEKAIEHDCKAEVEYERILWRVIRDWPIVDQWLTHVKGIGPRLSGLLVANIAPIERFPNVSKLWAYCGLHVVEYLTEISPDGTIVVLPNGLPEDERKPDCVYEIRGHAAKRRKGEKANWSGELKTTAWKIASSFLKAGGPYAELYQEYKTTILIRELRKGTIIWEGEKGNYRIAYAPITVFSSEPEVEWTVELEGKNLIAPLQRDSTRGMVIWEEKDRKQRLGYASKATLADLPQQRRLRGRMYDAQKLLIQSDLPKTPKGVPEWSMGRIHNMSCRWVGKLFLSHLWSVWREIEGLPVTEPYVISILGHADKIDPWSMAEQKDLKRVAG